MSMKKETPLMQQFVASVTTKFKTWDNTKYVYEKAAPEPGAWWSSGPPSPTLAMGLQQEQKSSTRRPLLLLTSPWPHRYMAERVCLFPTA